MSSFFSSQDGMLLAFGTLAHILQHGISDVGYNICVRVGSYRGAERKRKKSVWPQTQTRHIPINSAFSKTRTASSVFLNTYSLYCIHYTTKYHFFQLIQHSLARFLHYLASNQHIEQTGTSFFTLCCHQHPKIKTFSESFDYLIMG